jgi:hypothetical protein
VGLSDGEHSSLQVMRSYLFTDDEVPLGRATCRWFRNGATFHAG